MGRRGRAGALVAALAAVLAWWNTDLGAPPRFDGAGYSLLGLSLSQGRGYREIHQPGAPIHTHFPPGYPLALAALWSLTGRSDAAAHLFSIGLTAGAAWLGWRWLRTVEPRRVADPLGLAMAVNWTWGFVGGAIQSEPLYLLLSMLALNLTRRGRPIALGAVLGGCILTRHVGVCLAAAVVLDGLSRRRPGEAGRVILACLAVVAPWAVWLATAGGKTQAGLVEGEGLAGRIVGQSLFYVRRLPDALTGPLVEVATVFGRSRGVAIGATVAAGLASLVLVAGLVRSARDRRRRLAGLVPLLTLGLLLVWPFTEAGRFLIPLVPPLLVGMVEGLGWLWGLWGSAGVALRRRFALAMLAAAVPYPVYAVVSGRAAAQRATHADFDAACGWIAARGDRPGAVVSRHPGEVFWLTERTSVEADPSGLDGLEAQIRREGVAYLLVDPARYAEAPETPLERFVEERPSWVRLVRPGRVRVYEVSRDSGP